MKILYVLLAAIASEISYVISFFLLCVFVRILNLVYSIIRIQKKYVWIVGGLICGSLSLFIANFVSFFILKKHDFTETSIILVAIILPVIGQIGHYKSLINNTITCFVSRIHVAILVPPEIVEFHANCEYIRQEMSLQNPKLDLLKEENILLVEREAKDRTYAYLVYLVLWGIFGNILGLFFVHHYLFK